jgi:small subunit ribosomal protein S16
MAVHIRLARGGTNKRPFYRVIVADHRAPRGGKFLENIGTFNPLVRGDKEKSDVQVQLHLNKDRWDFWCARGAQPSATVASLVTKWEKSQAAAAKV